ncbi:unnamed protein product [Rangifer tarandus platyrhynchus]|uniref:Uncharacterized protein n=2 Tax=Rangifer tarandus platyrhynchus TaxID=3082113 RepID=A0ABN8Z3J8_RANTA|nr:unnamed protein product [Rangifer tarandus platyrhynchus]
MCLRKTAKEWQYHLAASGSRVPALSTALLRWPCVSYNISTAWCPPGFGKVLQIGTQLGSQAPPGQEGEYSFRTLAVTSATTFFPAGGLPPRLGEGVKRGSSG